jgi:ABC-type sugar transport system substrate-binding protein
MNKVIAASIVMLSMTSASFADTFFVNLRGPGGSSPFWTTLEEGAKKKGAELGVEVVVVAPPAETEVQTQISQLEDAIAQKVSGIAVAPLDDNAIKPVIEAAKNAGIPVILLDTTGSEEGLTYIGTDNIPASAAIAKYLCDNLPKGSEVAILQGLISMQVGQARAEGSRAAFEECGLKIVAEQTAEWDRSKGRSVTENILAANPNIKGIFGSNDPMALGAIDALKAANKMQDVTVVGFDGVEDALNSIKAGEMSATIAQKPSYIGELAIQGLVDMRAGKTLEQKIDPGFDLVTKENVAEFQ